MKKGRTHRQEVKSGDIAIVIENRRKYIEDQYNKYRNISIDFNVVLFLEPHTR